MMYGFRGHVVVKGKTEAMLDRFGSILMVEVSSDVDTTFYPNPFDDQGNPSPVQRAGIPIKAGVIRTIPMQMYNFKADNPVTVVGYRM